MSKTVRKKESSFFEKKEAKKLLQLAVAGSLLALAGCGFHPLYGEHSQAEEKLAGIDVAIIPDRTGQILRQELQRRLQGANSAPIAYTLNVSVALHTDIAGVIATNSVASYQRLSAVATWSLHPVGTPGVTTVKGVSTAVDSENILNQQYFAADLENTAVNDHLMELLADQMTAQIAAELSEPAKAAATTTTAKPAAK